MNQHPNHAPIPPLPDAYAPLAGEHDEAIIVDETWGTDLEIHPKPDYAMRPDHEIVDGEVVDETPEEPYTPPTPWLDEKPPAIESARHNTNIPVPKTPEAAHEPDSPELSEREKAAFNALLDKVVAEGTMRYKYREADKRAKQKGNTANQEDRYWNGYTTEKNGSHPGMRNILAGEMAEFLDKNPRYYDMIQAREAAQSRELDGTVAFRDRKVGELALHEGRVADSLRDLNNPSAAHMRSASEYFPKLDEREQNARFGSWYNTTFDRGRDIPGIGGLLQSVSEMRPTQPAQRKRAAEAHAHYTGDGETYQNDTFRAPAAKGSAHWLAERGMQHARNELRVGVVGQEVEVRDGYVGEARMRFNALGEITALAEDRLADREFRESHRHPDDFRAKLRDTKTPIVEEYVVEGGFTMRQDQELASQLTEVAKYIDDIDHFIATLDPKEKRVSVARMATLRAEMQGLYNLERYDREVMLINTRDTYKGTYRDSYGLETDSTFVEDNGIMVQPGVILYEDGSVLDPRVTPIVRRWHTGEPVEPVAA